MKSRSPRPHRCCRFVNKVENEFRLYASLGIPRYYHSPKVPLLVQDPGPILYRRGGSLSLTSPHPNGISVGSVVLRGYDACDPATDRHTDRPRYMCSNRLHPVLCNMLRPKRCFLAPHPARLSI